MRRAAAVGLVLLLAIGTSRGAEQVSSARPFPLVGHCRHDEAESPADRIRRQQALKLAREINAVQGLMLAKGGTFRRLAELDGLPPAPEGFILRLYTDWEGYVFSIKDARDLCGYGIFSDEYGLIYESTPRRPLAAHITNRAKGPA